MSIVRKSLQNDFQTLFDTVTLEQLESTTFQPLTSWSEVSPVSPIVLQEVEKPVKMSETCGENSTESFARLDQHGSWLRTYQGYSQVRMDGSLEEYSETW